MLLGHFFLEIDIRRKKLQKRNRVFRVPPGILVNLIELDYRLVSTELAVRAYSERKGVDELVECDHSVAVFVDRRKIFVEPPLFFVQIEVVGEVHRDSLSQKRAVVQIAQIFENVLHFSGSGKIGGLPCSEIFTLTSFEKNMCLSSCWASGRF